MTALKKHARSIIITAAAIGLALTTSAAMNDAAAGPRDGKGRFLPGTSRAAKPPARPLTGVLNINKATEKELLMLPGIGPSKAKAIVAYRGRRGAFRRVRDLRRVKGIGRKTVQRLARHLSVKGASTLRAGPPR